MKRDDSVYIRHIAGVSQVWLTVTNDIPTLRTKILAILRAMR